MAHLPPSAPAQQKCLGIIRHHAGDEQKKDSVAHSKLEPNVTTGQQRCRHKRQKHVLIRVWSIKTVSGVGRPWSSIFLPS